MTDEQTTTELLKRFSPLDGLKRDNLAALARKVQVRELSPGQVLFKEGDTEKRTFYIVAGTLELVDHGKVVGTVEGGSDFARNPVAPVFPRRVSAKARDRVQFISVDSDLLDVMLTWDQTGSYEVSELKGGKDGGNNEDWMTMLLQTKAFHKIPPANIQAIFMRMQQINYKAGDIVLKQGAEGDYFYVLTPGYCPRDPRDSAQQGRHQARRTVGRRYVRRGSIDLRREAQCHRHDDSRGGRHAARQGRLQEAAQ